MTALAIIAASYVLGTIPVAWLTGRLAKSVDLRDYGSGNTGASNVWQSVSRALVVPVGLLQIAQGAAGVLLARDADPVAWGRERLTDCNNHPVYSI